MLKLTSTNYEIDDTIIVINSSNRAGELKTPLMFPEGVMNWVIAIPEEQEVLYLDFYPAERLLPIPDGIPHELPAQRQFVMEYFEAYKYVWLMDDDLTFFHRNDELLLRKVDQKFCTEMFKAMHRELQDFNMVGISTRLGNNRISTDYDETNRCTRCYAMNREVFMEVGAKFNPIPNFVAEDFHMTLCFLNAGHNNRILHTFAQEDIGSNADGGCSVYRTYEVQKTTSHWMENNHPEVKVKVKSSKNAWGLKSKKDGTFSRVDVIVGWKKAYKPKRRAGGLSALLSKKK